jgi:hypothetical protein
MTTLLASRDTIGLDSPTLLQDSTTHELDDVLTPLTAEELEMDGAGWFSDIIGGAIIMVGTAFAPVTAPILAVDATFLLGDALFGRGLYLGGW